MSPKKSSHAPKTPVKLGKLTPAEATIQINALAKMPIMKLSKTPHAESQLKKRDIITGDILYLLKFGFIYDNAEEATQKNLWKYKIESKTPNSGNRIICLIAIPDFKSKHLKIVTDFWKDTKK